MRPSGAAETMPPEAAVRACCLACCGKLRAEATGRQADLHVRVSRSGPRTDTPRSDELCWSTRSSNGFGFGTYGPIDDISSYSLQLSTPPPTVTWALHACNCRRGQMKSSYVQLQHIYVWWTYVSVSFAADVLFGPLTLTQQQPIDGHLISRS
jgi:hypothetical protein